MRTVDITAGTMARSGSSGSESLFGVDLERGSDGGDKPVEAMTQQCNFCTHTMPAPHALSSVSKGATRRYPWIGSWLRHAQVSHSRKYVAKRSSEPLKKIRPAALHLMNSVFVIVLVD